MGISDSAAANSRFAPDGRPVIETLELELLKLVRHIETFGRRSSLYKNVDRAGYLALRTIDALGPSSINGLARTLGLDASTVTRQVAALRAGQLVTKELDPSDRRSWVIGLTPRGRRVMSTVERSRRRAIESTLAGWEPTEVNDLARVLAKLNQALQTGST
jgi:DNA-binding MarR family transcriptional regulator